jgi:hypothetical protein
MTYETSNSLIHDSEADLDTDFQLDSLLTSDGLVELDDMFDLTKLLNESLSAKKDAEAVKAARKRLNSSSIPLSATDREATEALVRSWEIKREWQPISNTIIFEVQNCTGCGTSHKHFIGIFQQQDHRSSKISRWIKSPEDVALPKNCKENETQVGICAGCCISRGWGAENE